MFNVLDGWILTKELENLNIKLLSISTHKSQQRKF
jgi:hypothetical protein